MRRTQRALSKKVIAAALGVTFSTAVVFASQPASATNLLNLAKNLIKKEGGKYLGGGGPSVDQATIQNNVNTGIANLGAKINAQLAGGQLTAGEYAQLSGELDKLRSLNAAFLADGVYSNEETNQILAAMSNFNNVYANVLAHHVTVPAYAAPATPTGLVNTQLARAWAPVTKLQATVTSRINAGLADGSLTASEAASFKSQLETLNRELAANRRTFSGNLNLVPTYKRLSDLNKRVAQLSASRLF